MEERTISCETIEYNSVSHNLYVDGEQVAEVWKFTLDTEGLDIDEIVISEDGAKLEGNFEVVVNDNYELIELR